VVGHYNRKERSICKIATHLLLEWMRMGQTTSMFTDNLNGASGLGSEASNIPSLQDGEDANRDHDSHLDGHKEGFCGTCAKQPSHSRNCDSCSAGCSKSIQCHVRGTVDSTNGSEGGCLDTKGCEPKNGQDEKNNE